MIIQKVDLITIPPYYCFDTRTLSVSQERGLISRECMVMTSNV